MPVCGGQFMSPGAFQHAPWMWTALCWFQLWLLRRHISSTLMGRMNCEGSISSVRCCSRSWSSQRQYSVYTKQRPLFHQEVVMKMLTAKLQTSPSLSHISHYLYISCSTLTYLQRRRPIWQLTKLSQSQPPQKCHRHSRINWSTTVEHPPKRHVDKFVTVHATSLF